MTSHPDAPPPAGAVPEAGPALTIERLVLRFVRLELRQVFQNRWQKIRGWTKLLVDLETADGRVGHGECMAMEMPYYSYETIETSWLVIERYLKDLVLGKTFDHPFRVADALAPIAGHSEARSALESAFWDLWARAREEPLYRLFGGTRRPVESGATIGVVRGDIDGALAATQVAVDSGYRRLKFKIKRGWDQEILEPVRSAFPQITFLADANCAYGEGDVDWVARLDRFAPILLEQPFPAGAWHLYGALGQKTEAVVCLDESVESMEDVEQLIRLGAIDLVNLKIGRVGGPRDALAIYRKLTDAGIPLFIGSKTETGIGRWLNIAMATLENVRYPSDVAASERYFAQEVVQDPVRLVSPGHVQPLEGAGIGTEPDPTTLVRHTIRTAVFPH